MSSNLRPANDSRAREGTSSTKPSVSQAYGQPLTNAAYQTSRHTASVSVPRSQGRPKKYYHETTGYGRSRRGEHSSNNDNEYTSRVANRRDHTTNIESLERPKKYDDRYERVAPLPRRGEAQDDDSGSDVKGSYGARHRPLAQQNREMRGTAAQNRHDTDFVSDFRRRSDPNRGQTEHAGRSFADDKGNQHSDSRRDKNAGLFERSSRHSKGSDDIERDAQRKMSREGPPAHSVAYRKPSKASHTDQQREEDDSGRDISGAYGARRNSSPPRHRHAPVLSAADKYTLSRQSTSQAHAAMTSSRPHDVTQTHREHSSQYGLEKSQEGRHRSGEYRHDHNRDLNARQGYTHRHQDDRPRVKSRHAEESRHKGSDSDDVQRNPPTVTKHASRSAGRHHGPTGNEDTRDALSGPFRGLRIKKLPGKDGDGDDGDDIGGTYGSRGVRSSRHTDSKPPRPAPDDDDDIGGTYGSRHV